MAWIITFFSCVVLIFGSLSCLYKSWVPVKFAGIFECFKILGIIMLLALTFYYFNQNLKKLIKSVISDSKNEKIYPHKLELKSVRLDSTEAFSDYVVEHGGVVEYPIFPKNTILLGSFINEFISIPIKTLSVEKAHKQLDKSYFIQNDGFTAGKYNLRSYSQLFSGKYLDKVIQADAADFSYLIGDYVENSGTQFQKDVTYIEDVEDLITYVLSINAYKRVFGKKLMDEPKMLKIVRDITGVNFLERASVFDFLEKIRRYFENKKFDEGLKFVSKIIAAELRNNLPPELDIENICLIQLLKKKPEFYEGSGIASVSNGILQTFKGMVVIPPTRILNVLIEISLNTDILHILTIEQETVVGKLGQNITLESLNQMKVLQKFIMKSMLKASPASYMHRKVEQDIVLSNGITLVKDSMVSINLFSEYHTSITPQLSKDRPSNKVPSSPSKTEINEKKHFELLWGYGDQYCPFADYSLMQMKLLIAILIRRYNILAHVREIQQPHPGYDQISTVVPKLHSVYLKKKRLF